MAAIIAPPSAGPITAASCHPPLFQVTALARCRSGTSEGSSALRAGAWKAGRYRFTRMQPYSDEDRRVLPGHECEAAGSSARMRLAPP